MKPFLFVVHLAIVAPPCGADVPMLIHADGWSGSEAGCPRVVRTGFRVARDISLSFDHQLGTAEAKRRVADRLERLRGEFANKIGASTITWRGDEAQIEATAFAQNASGHVVVSDTNVHIDVHLPLLLAPLGGNIEAFLTKTARETLAP